MERSGGMRQHVFKGSGRLLRPPGLESAPPTHCVDPVKRPCPGDGELVAASEIELGNRRRVDAIVDAGRLASEMHCRDI